MSAKDLYEGKLGALELEGVKIQRGGCHAAASPMQKAALASTVGLFATHESSSEMDMNMSSEVRCMVTMESQRPVVKAKGICLED